MGDDAGIGTADRGRRLADRNAVRGLDDAGIGTAVGAGVGAAVGDGIGHGRRRRDRHGRRRRDRRCRPGFAACRPKHCAWTGRRRDRHRRRCWSWRGRRRLRWPTGRAQAARASVAAPSGKQLRLDGGRSVGPQRRLAIILRAGVFTFASGCQQSPRSGTPARRYHRPEGGFPVSPGAYLPRTDAGPPGSPPWRALLRRRPSRWLPSAAVMSETASVEKRSAGAAPCAAQAAQAAECRAAATAVADRAGASSARERCRHERQAAAS